MWHRTIVQQSCILPHPPTYTNFINSSSYIIFINSSLPSYLTVLHHLYQQFYSTVHHFYQQLRNIFINSFIPSLSTSLRFYTIFISSSVQSFSTVYTIFISSSVQSFSTVYTIFINSYLPSLSTVLFHYYHQSCTIFINSSAPPF